MNAYELQSFAEKNGFRWVDGCAYGNVGEYPMLFRLNGAAKGSMVIATFALPYAAAYKAIKPALKNGLKRVASHQLLANETLMLTIPAKAETLEATFTAAISCVVTALREKGIKAPASCPICGQTNCDSVAHVGQAYRPVHRACLTGAYSAAKAKAEENEMNGNLLTGLLGAILGGVVGCLPTLLSIFFAERIFAILYALIPLGIYYGYKLLNGRMNKAVRWITVIFSVIFAVGIEFALIAIVMLQAEIPLMYMMDFIGMPEISEALGSEIPTSLLFVALGIWIAWAQISKTSDTAVKSAESTLATLISYGDGE